MTDAQLQAIITAIRETGRALITKPWPEPGASTVTLPDGAVISLAGYRQTDVIFEAGTLCDAPFGARVVACGDGSYHFRAMPGWRSAPPWIITRVACDTDAVVEVAPRLDAVHRFHGRDLLLGRTLAPPIVVQDGYEWFVRASKPARVVLGGLVRVG